MWLVSDTQPFLGCLEKPPKYRTAAATEAGTAATTLSGGMWPGMRVS